MEGLSNENVALLIEIDEVAGRVKRLVEKLKARGGDVGGVTVMPQSVDPRWVAIGTTELQVGFQSLRRAVERPSYF